MKGTASSCCVARDTSGRGSSGSGAREPKDIDHDHFTRTSPPGADLQSARLDQCEKRDDTGRHLRLAQRGQSRSEEHTSELQSPCNLVCRLLLEKKKKKKI